MSVKSTRTTIAVTLFVVVIGLAAYASNWQRVQAFNPEKLNATFFRSPRAVSDFVLQDQDGYPFTNEKLSHQWTLLFFGFTSCGYICPTTMAMLGQSVDLMQQAHLRYMPQVVFVSVDPARDSSEKIKKYVTSFNKDFKGVRGDEDSVKKLAQEMAVVYMKVAGTAAKENYDINHSGSIMLINPKGQLQALFSPPHHPDQLAKDFAIISKHIKG